MARRIDSDDPSSESSDSDAGVLLPRRIFPPPLGPIAPHSHPKFLQARTPTPSRSNGLGFAPPKRPDERKDRRLVPEPGAARNPGAPPTKRLHPVPPPPTYPPSDGSESSYDEVSSNSSTTPLRDDGAEIGKLIVAYPTLKAQAGYSEDMQTMALQSGYDEDSSIEPSETDSIELEYRRLEDKRDEVAELREDIRETRLRLKTRRVAKDAADNAFMTLVRPVILTGRLDPLAMSTGLLEDRLLKLQATRNEYQDLEASYENLEEQLNEAEKELDKLERQFISRLYYPVRHSGGDEEEEEEGEVESDDGAVPPSRTSLLGIPADRPYDVHPLYHRFMSAIGTYQLAKEHLEDLALRKTAIEQEQRNLRLIERHHPRELATHVKHISDADLEFLRDFQDEQQEAQDEVEKQGGEVDRLKRLCQEKGAIPKHAPFHELYTFQPELAGDDMSIDGSPEMNTDPANILTGSRFSILLANPSHVLEDQPMTARGALKRAVKLPPDHPRKKVLVDAAMREISIENLLHDSNPDDKSDMINRWLLHRLRTSPLEAELLYSYFVSRLKVLDLKRWQWDVLYQWPRDHAANIPAEVFAGPVTSAGEEIRSRNSDVGTLPSQMVNSWATLSRRRPQSDPGYASPGPGP
ncbi:hypothetical protein NKR23_g7033 [Pleurostoma richardsiae]|uniref:Uncharacterized protein n=1 Tax=Pleurostoma richardsiae TaxID=41990 RepID=A0AA38VDP7_9PEZI|nr:hypothetical protein NKR23_g7033 [Pleurostoma richardsiae]